MPHLLERHWREPRWYLSALLKPLSVLFQTVALRRRRAALLKPPEKLPVPIIVMGNIHVGGVGKTPMVVALTQALQQRGVKVGLISRGYGAITMTYKPFARTAWPALSAMSLCCW